MNRDIMRRISAFLGSEEVFTRLSAMPAKDLNSLMIYVYEQRAKSLSVSNLLGQLFDNRFVSPSDIGQRTLISFDHLAYSILPEEFEGIELSPLAPLGTNTVLAGTNQKNVMTTIRGVEVVADPTTSLALECAKRRQDLTRLSLGDEMVVKLATSARCVRTQDFSSIPGFKSHFQIFALASAWSESQKVCVETKIVTEHISYYLQLLRGLSENGYWFGDVTVSISDIRITEILIKRYGLNRDQLSRETQTPGYNYFKEAGIGIPMYSPVVDEQIRKELGAGKIGHLLKDLELIGDEIFKKCRQLYPSAHFVFDFARLAGIGYYPDLCFKITATNNQGQVFPLIDGGMPLWTSVLLQMRKEKLMVSGIGTEIVCQNFRGGENK